MLLSRFSADSRKKLFPMVSKLEQFCLKSFWFILKTHAWCYYENPENHLYFNNWMPKSELITITEDITATLMSLHVSTVCNDIQHIAPRPFLGSARVKSFKPKLKSLSLFWDGAVFISRSLSPQKRNCWWDRQFFYGPAGKPTLYFDLVSHQ